MWYFGPPGEELQADLPMGSKCVHVLMDMWDSSVNLVRQDFVMNQQMVDPLLLVYRVIAMDTQISVMLRQVSIICFCAVQSTLLPISLYFSHLGTSLQHLYFKITKTTAENHHSYVMLNLRFFLFSKEYMYIYVYICIYMYIYTHTYVKGKAIPIQALTGPEGSRSLRLPDFKTIGT
jgi:hypothetical protein